MKLVITPLLVLCLLSSAVAADMPLGPCVVATDWAIDPSDPPGTATINDTDGRTMLEYLPQASNDEAKFKASFVGLDPVTAYRIELDVETGGSSGRFQFSISSTTNEERGISRAMAPEKTERLSWDANGGAIEVVMESDGDARSKFWAFVGPLQACPMGPAE